MGLPNLTAELINYFDYGYSIKKRDGILVIDWNTDEAEKAIRQFVFSHGDKPFQLILNNLSVLMSSIAAKASEDLSARFGLNRLFIYANPLNDVLIHDALVDSPVKKYLPEFILDGLVDKKRQAIRKEKRASKELKKIDWSLRRNHAFDLDLPVFGLKEPTKLSSTSRSDTIDDVVEFLDNNPTIKKDYDSEGCQLLNIGAIKSWHNALLDSRYKGELEAARKVATTEPTRSDRSLYREYAKNVWKTKDNNETQGLYNALRGTRRALLDVCLGRVDFPQLKTSIEQSIEE